MWNYTAAWFNKPMNGVYACVGVFVNSHWSEVDHPQTPTHAWEWVSVVAECLINTSADLTRVSVCEFSTLVMY